MKLLHLEILLHSTGIYTCI